MILYVGIINRLLTFKCKIAHNTNKWIKRPRHVTKNVLESRFHFSPFIFTNMNLDKNPRSTVIKENTLF